MLWKTFTLTIKLKGFTVTCLPPSERKKYTSRLLTFLTCFHITFPSNFTYPICFLFTPERCVTINPSNKLERGFRRSS